MQFIMYVLIKNIVYILYIIEFKSNFRDFEFLIFESKLKKFDFLIFYFKLKNFEFEIFESSTIHEMINFDFLIFESRGQTFIF